jgi:integrase
MGFKMFRSSGPMTLGAYAREAYSLRRDCKPSTLRQYQISADLFERWAGRPIQLAELDEDSLSAFLRDYSATASPHTVRGKKAMILALWRAAADDRLADEPIARRVRRVRLPEIPVDAWTREEVERLLVACSYLPRRHPCGLTRAAWFDLAIRIAWDSGLRKGDLIELTASAIRPDGSGQWTQSKTAKVIAFQLSRTTMEILEASLAECPRRLVCPWGASHETFGDQVTLLVHKAGVREGTWKWIRRGSGSDVEAQSLGSGHEHLGNTRRVFEQSYACRSIIGRQIPRPRELLVGALRRQNRKTGGGGVSQGNALN